MILTENNECKIICYPTCKECHGNGEFDCGSCYLGSELTEDGSCVCKAAHYFNVESQRCEACHGLCRECVGPSNKECRECNTDLALKIWTEDFLEVDWCAYNCESLGAHYKDDLYCKRTFLYIVACHDDCKTCYGSTEFDCLSCKEGFLHSRKCIDFCPDKTYVSEELCLGIFCY